MGTVVITSNVIRAGVVAVNDSIRFEKESEHTRPYGLRNEILKVLIPNKRSQLEHSNCINK
jgi:hypothetical protein